MTGLMLRSYATYKSLVLALVSLHDRQRAVGSTEHQSHTGTWGSRHTSCVHGKQDVQESVHYNTGAQLHTKKLLKK